MLQFLNTIRASYRAARDDATVAYDGDGTTYEQRRAMTRPLEPYDPSKHTLELDPGPILGAWHKYKASRKDRV